MVARNNDLSDTEKLLLRRIKIEHGYSQHCEFVNPEARFIFRCPLCTSVLNSNGVERSVRVHFNRRHSTLQGLTRIKIIRSDKKEFALLIRGKNAPPNTNFELPKMRPEYNREQHISPAPQLEKPFEQTDFITEELEFEIADDPKEKKLNPETTDPNSASEPEDIIVPSAPTTPSTQPVPLSQTTVRPQTDESDEARRFHEDMFNAPIDPTDDGADDSHEAFEADRAWTRADPNQHGTK